MRPEERIRIALDLLDGMRSGRGKAADERLRRYFQQNRRAGSRDRAWIAATVYAVLRHRRRIGWRVERWVQNAGLEPAGSMRGRARDLAALLLLAEEGLLPEDAETLVPRIEATAGRERRVARRLRRLLETPRPPKDPGTADVDAFAVTMNLPRWAAVRLWRERGRAGATALAEALAEMAPVDLRIHPLRTTRQALQLRLQREMSVATRPTPWSPWGLRAEGRPRVTDGRAFREGLFEIQDEGSQLVVLALDAQPGWKVIDACAGGGGKTLALAAAMRNRGRIYAADTHPGRLRELARRKSRAGFSNIEILPIEPLGELPEALPAGADLVLVDAPCSGSGTWRRNPELKDRYGEGDLARFAERQLGILRRFAPRVRAGGCLAYVTCSLFEDENERVVERFLREHDGWTVVPPPGMPRHMPRNRWDAGDGLVRLDPVRSGTDGFFLAVLRRAG